MTEHAHPILTMDGYQLVALTRGHAYDPDRLIAYVVMTMSGARLHHERTLEDARSWMERQVDGGKTASQRKARRRRTRPFSGAPVARSPVSLDLDVAGGSAPGPSGAGGGAQQVAHEASVPRCVHESLFRFGQPGRPASPSTVTVPRAEHIGHDAYSRTRWVTTYDPRHT